jgi:hypothetical protein
MKLESYVSRDPSVLQVSSKTVTELYKYTELPQDHVLYNLTSYIFWCVVSGLKVRNIFRGKRKKNTQNASILNEPFCVLHSKLRPGVQSVILQCIYWTTLNTTIVKRRCQINENGALLEWYWQGRREELGEKTCQSAILSTTHLTWTALGPNMWPPRWQAGDWPPQPWHGSTFKEQVYNITAKCTFSFIIGHAKCTLTSNFNEAKAVSSTNYSSTFAFLCRPPGMQIASPRVTLWPSQSAAIPVIMSQGVRFWRKNSIWHKMCVLVSSETVTSN